MNCGISVNKKPTVNRFLRLAGVLGVFCFSNVALAENYVSLTKAIALSLKQNPELASYAHRDAAAKALVEQARVASPITVNAVAEDAFGSGSFAGVQGLQTTLSISWLLERDIIASRVDLASAKVNTTAAAKAIKAVDVASDTAQIFIQLLAQKEKLKLAKLASKQASDVLAQIGKKVAAGKLIVVDELRAKAALSSYQLEVEDLTHEIEASKAQLAAQWQGTADFTAVGDLAKIPSLAQLDEVLEELKSNPWLQQYAIAQEVMQAEIDVAVAQQQPAWQMTAGVRRNEALDDFAFTAGVSIPLGAADRNKGLINSIKAKQSQSQAEANALYKQISTQALLLSHKLKHNRHVIEGLTKQSIPYLEQASAKAQHAYEVGSYRYTDLYAVRQELIKAQSQLIDAYKNIQVFNIELERLTGTSVSR